MYSHAERMANSRAGAGVRPSLELRIRSVPAFIFLVLLLLDTGLAMGEQQVGGPGPEEGLVRERLANCLDTCASAGKRAGIFECPGGLDASFTTEWAEFIRSDLTCLEQEVKYLVLSTDLQMKNEGMDEIIASLARTTSRIEELQGIAYRFASRCPVWVSCAPFLKENASSSESGREEFRCLAKSLFASLLKDLSEAKSTQNRLLAQQQDALSSLAQMRADLAAKKEQQEAARSRKAQLLAALKAGPDGEKAVPAVFTHCKKMLLTAIKDAEAQGIGGDSERLPSRFPPPIASKPDNPASPERELGPSLAVAPRSSVFSVAGGGVALSEYLPGFGLTIVLRHGRNEATVFSHLAASLVRAGDQVRAGQRIGLSGESGLTRSPSLLFALLENGEIEDLRARIDWPSR
ncbi:MAG: peptidoglycan DD-metalloendopeptidase family protein [Candidatus Coatesbacteria bacterium]|nr:peptidoglycan DD-metalloendopeptidase family protein [Candidatus Coatesbacteria bacterium]